MQKPALLKIVDQFGVNKRLPLAKRVFTIGRKAGNDLLLLSSDVSRDHGAIVYEGGTYYLVRPVGTGCRGTYDDGSTSQQGGRDVETASAPTACP